MLASVMFLRALVAAGNSDAKSSDAHSKTVDWFPDSDVSRSSFPANDDVVYKRLIICLLFAIIVLDLAAV